MNPEILSAIEKYACCELSLENLCRVVREERGSAFIHNPNYRWVTLHQVCPEPKVRITQQHIEIALAMRALKEISERQLIDWATMLLINEVYFWDGEDAAVVVDWLNRISLDLPEY
jgi:hypothetical protein